MDYIYVHERIIYTAVFIEMQHGKGTLVYDSCASFLTKCAVWITDQKHWGGNKMSDGKEASV